MSELAAENLKRRDAATKRGWKLTTLPMTQERCRGCYNDVYNGQLASQCWSFAGAVVVLKKAVHVDQVPPWEQKALELPDCYRRQRFIYVGVEVTR